MTRSLLLPAASLALAACSAPTHAPALAPAPRPDLAYTLEWLGTPEPRLRATLELDGEPDGTTRVGLAGAWGGVPSDGAWIRELRAFGADGRVLEVAHASALEYELRHAAGERVRVAWHLEPLADEAADRPNEYRPIVRAQCVHLIGNNALVAPLDLVEPAAARSIALEWRGFARAGWNTLSSHGVGARLRVERPLADFLQALFVAGAVDIERRAVPGGALLVAAPRDPHALDLELLADACERIVAAERAFFDDHSQPYYLICALPVGAADPQRVSLGGTGLTDSFALFHQRGSTLAPGGAGREPLLGVLAHELFHNWCGLGIGPEGTEQLVYWFTEGFTELYTGRMLRRAGLLDAEGRRRWANELLASYAGSSARDLPNEAIAAGFWSDPEVGLLPYRRGALAALALDGAIRRVSRGERTLDDLMRALLGEARSGETFTTEELLARFERWTDADFRARLEVFLVRGGPQPWSAADLAAFGELGTCESFERDPGLDVGATIRDRAVRGVREQGPAWRAGLRDGQPLAGFSWNMAGGPIAIQVREDGSVVDRSYEPRGARMELPCFAPLTDAREP